jgi:hypothetical protein
MEYPCSFDVPIDAAGDQVGIDKERMHTIALADIR